MGTIHDTFRQSPGALRWPTLFSPYQLRGRTVANRFTSTPHSTGWGHGGLLTQAEVDYHVRKAAGGVGLVMTFGSAAVDPNSAASYGSISLWDERNDLLLRQLAERVHEHGALIMSQMTHMGRRGNSLMSGVALKAVSDLPEGVHHEVPAVITVPELEALVTRFGDAAQRLMGLGWDGAEVTSQGGHLIEQFFDPSVNDRTDQYGGSLENRVRFARQVFAAVRDATSDDFLLSFRMSAHQGLGNDEGMSEADLEEVAKALTAERSVDLLSVAGGTGYTVRSSSVFVPSDELPANANGAHGGRLRRATGVPVVVAGRILDADTAEHALSVDGVDLVAMTRALIADPDLPRKYAAGIAPRPCISLNQGCIGRLYSGLPMWCSVNPGIREPEVDVPIQTLGPEGITYERPTEAPQRVVVVGAGPAGAEAAWRAARRGSAVTLFERSDQIGGRTELAGRRPGRERWALYLQWLKDQLGAAGVDTRFGVAPTAEDVLDLDPDLVVVATGSVPRVPAWAEGSPTPVVDADDVIARAPQPQDGGAVLVVDDEGGFVAPTAAEALVRAGWSVRIATSLTYVAAEVDPTQVWFVRRRLKLAGVELIDSVRVAKALDGWDFVDLESDLRRPAGRVDLVVHADLRRSADRLSSSLSALRPDLQVVVVGDALAPRQLLDAAAEGARAGMAWTHPERSVEPAAEVSAG